MAQTRKAIEARRVRFEDGVRALIRIHVVNYCKEQAGRWTSPYFDFDPIARSELLRIVKLLQQKRKPK
jgi:hypothetical protein